MISHANDGFNCGSQYRKKYWLMVKTRFGWTIAL